MTKTIIFRQSDGLVQYAVPDGTATDLTQSPAVIGAMRVGDVSSATHFVASGVTLPSDYTGGIYTYAAGAFTLTLAESSRRAAAATAALAAAQAAALVTIDSAAEAARLALISPGSGQALEYQQTSDEAAAAALAADPLDATKYPMLSAEVTAQAAAGVTITLRQAQQQVSAQQAAWVAASASIKAARRAAKLQVPGATSIAAVDTIVATAQTAYQTILQQAGAS